VVTYGGKKTLLETQSLEDTQTLATAEKGKCCENLEGKLKTKKARNIQTSLGKKGPEGRRKSSKKVWGQELPRQQPICLRERGIPPCYQNSNVDVTAGTMQIGRQYWGKKQMVTGRPPSKKKNHHFPEKKKGDERENQRLKGMRVKTTAGNIMNKEPTRDGGRER